MPVWEVDWSAYGTASVDADTKEEAEREVTDAIFGFDTLMLDSVDVDGVEVTDATTDDDMEVEADEG